MKRKPNAYPLDVKNVGEDSYIVMSKGHHEALAFMRAVRAAGYDWPLGAPEQRWCRTVPDRRPYGHVLYVFVPGPGPGVFPVTYAWEVPDDEVYVPPAEATP